MKVGLVEVMTFIKDTIYNERNTDRNYLNGYIWYKTTDETWIDDKAELWQDDDGNWKKRIQIYHIVLGSQNMSIEYWNLTMML